MARRKNRSQLTTISNIDMTPLIDLTFLLLIVFMITVPLMEYSVDVSPPEMNASPLPENNTFNVAVNSRGEIFLKDSIVTPDDLDARLKAAINNRHNLTVLLKADGSISYNRVIEVMKIIKDAGVKKISLVTQAE